MTDLILVVGQHPIAGAFVLIMALVGFEQLTSCIEDCVRESRKK